MVLKRLLMGAWGIGSGWLLLLMFGFMACSPSRYNMVNAYLDSTKTLQIKGIAAPYEEPVIKKYDIVRVSFAGMNPNVTAMLNSYGGVQMKTTLEGSAIPEIAGQQVNKDGYLEFPLIGSIRAEGLTKAGLRDTLLRAITPLLQSPFVLVELPQRGVTVLGEVRTPSTTLLPKERANLFEVLAQVGYTTDFADLSKVKIYRENANGTRELGNLNLQDTSIFHSPYFYPKSDDVIIVPASGEKRLRNIGQSVTLFTALLVAISSILLAVSR
jgi:polysaccharide export outer membrane protein